MPTSDQKQKAETFTALHQPGTPISLFNIWDPVSAQTVERSGAQAIATSSAAVALAHGFMDGQQLPFELLLGAITRIANATKLPVTADVEAGYGVSGNEIKETISQVIGAGAIGVNMEDQVIGEDRLFSPAEQTARIAGARAAAEQEGVPLHINARTDLFLKAQPDTHTQQLVTEALERAEVYAKAGASSLFVPGLVDPELIKALCDASPLPVNIMGSDTTPSIPELGKLGVARVSLGFWPMLHMLQTLGAKAKEFYETGSVTNS